MRLIFFVAYCAPPCPPSQFDAYALDAEAGGRPLSVLGFWLLHHTGVTAAAGLDRTKLARWLCRIEDGYRWEPTYTQEVQVVT